MVQVWKKGGRPRWNVEGKNMTIDLARIEAAYKIFDFDVEELTSGVWVGIEGFNPSRGLMKLGVNSLEVCDHTKNYENDTDVQELIWALTDRIFSSRFVAINPNDN